MEAEFYAAVESGKLAIYQRSILRELEMPQDQPTLIYIDNQALFDIANVGRPTPRMRHVDVQCFLFSNGMPKDTLSSSKSPAESILLIRSPKQLPGICLVPSCDTRWDIMNFPQSLVEGLPKLNRRL